MKSGSPCRVVATQNRARATDLLELLMLTRWWIGPLLAVLTFVAVRWLISAWLPAQFPEPGFSHYLFTGLARGATIYAWQAGGVVLMIWGTAEITNQRHRKLLDSQSGIESVCALDWKEFEAILGEIFRHRGYTVRWPRWRSRPPIAEGRPVDARLGVVGPVGAVRGRPIPRRWARRCHEPPNLCKIGWVAKSAS